MITEKEICMELMNLIEKSELRIDRTNKMVAMLTEVSKRISESYMQHINTLCINRDKMLEQISRLTAMLCRGTPPQRCALATHTKQANTSH